MMLRATKEEEDDVRGYFEWQAPELEITFLQKVYVEAILGTPHAVWDIHTTKDRWWVITNPLNLYSQEQFPNMDLCFTFHMGLRIRTPKERPQDQAPEAMRLLPFGTTFAKLRDAHDSLSSAMRLSDFQTIGVRSREVMLDFIGAAQDSARWTGDPPKRENFRGWIEIIINDLYPGDTNKERRGLLKGAAESAWTFANWLAHSKSSTWRDAELALSMMDFAVGNISSIILHEIRGVPLACPKCGSSHLHPEVGEYDGDVGRLWERPVCLGCGWQGRVLPILSALELKDLVTRQGDDGTDDHSIMTQPLRSLRRPDDT
ncbi:hypothetical protein [Neorhizobium sp. T25_27]|uniref:hypothetical protein n=1 Tax=Neorhizobium sp. T25_27 TaxID=2093831 RepID=UPI00155F1793|nr:hypothetical protein [Neorhizobium sp. T25_27]